MRAVTISFLTALLMLSTPLAAYAFPFGGQITIIKPCYNNAIYVNLSPPRGGAFIWTPATKTYQFGPPRHGGQGPVGLAGAPFYLAVFIFPPSVWQGPNSVMWGVALERN